MRLTTKQPYLFDFPACDYQKSGDFGIFDPLFSRRQPDYACPQRKPITARTEAVYAHP
jgi:hypothetical protein